MKTLCKIQYIENNGKIILRINIGVINPGQKFRNEESFKKTCEKLYGGCGLASNKIRKKYEKTNLENVGRTWNNNPIKQKETNIEKFGVEYTIGKEYTRKIFNVDNVSQLDYVKQKKIKTCIKNFGCDNPSKSKQIRDKKRKKYTYDGKNFDSSWEIAYYIYLTDHHIRFEYHPMDIDYYSPIDGKYHKYELDFKLFNNTYVEIKNIKLLEKMKSNVNDNEYYKYICMIQNNVIIKTDCKKYIQYVNCKYGSKFLKSLKNKKEK